MEVIDLKGLRCPLPILKTKKALAKLVSGATLCVLVTDDSAPVDFELFCQQTGHILLDNSVLEDKSYQIIIQHK